MKDQVQNWNIYLHYVILHQNYILNLKKDTAEVGKLILRLREKLETVTDELTKNAADSKNGDVMKGCTDFLVKEAERLVAIQE